LENQQTSERKKDHIELAFKSALKDNDSRFYYEPLFKGHPNVQNNEIPFLGKTLAHPMWISSMTGGTKEASIINQNLAKACGEYKLGMGLGSCRIILNDDTYLPDFQMRKYLGDAPFYANLGIAQLEELFSAGKQNLILELISKTETDGLIIHINPLQEWTQLEGDFIKESPIDTIKRCLELNINLIVKEVGQGFGPKSIDALLQLPLKAIDYGAFGGTNFSLLEILRDTPMRQKYIKPVAHLGHSAIEMNGFLKDSEYNTDFQGDIIISGGIKNFLDGYYAVETCPNRAVYGQASAFLNHARGDYQELQEFIEIQIKGFALAQQYLTIKK
jgi:isopentenyl-diphosphate delta-isomerase